MASRLPQTLCVLPAMGSSLMLDNRGDSFKGVPGQQWTKQRWACFGFFVMIPTFWWVSLSQMGKPRKTKNEWKWLLTLLVKSRGSLFRVIGILRLPPARKLSWKFPSEMHGSFISILPLTWTWIKGGKCNILWQWLPAGKCQEGKGAHVNSNTIVLRKKTIWENLVEFRKDDCV